MKHYCGMAAILCFTLVIVAACEREPPPPPEPVVEVPPEPTPDEYNQQLKGLMGQLLMPGLPAGSDESIQGILSQMQGRRMQLVATENGRGGLQLITQEVDNAIRSAKDEERWVKVKALCMVYEILQPGNGRYAKLLEQATVMMNRPQITVTGFIELDGELYVFMDLFDPKTNETKNYRRREGEEFHDVMRVVRIIGNQQSVEVEYLPARFIWTVPGPRERLKTGS